MYSKPIKIYIGINNPIKILCLNDDQKAVDITGLSIQLNVFEPTTRALLISKPATNVDYSVALGISSVTIGYPDLAGLDIGSYEIGLTATDNSGNVTTLYVDCNYTSRLPLELKKGPVENINSPVFLGFSVDSSNANIVSQFVSLANAPANDTNFSVQTDLIAYSGNLHFQASNVANPNSTSFSDLSITNYSNYTGTIISTANSNGNVSWLAILLDNTTNVSVTANSILRY